MKKYILMLLCVATMASCAQKTSRHLKKMKDVAFDTTSNVLADGSLNQHVISYIGAIDFMTLYQLSYDFSPGYKFYFELDTANIEIFRRANFGENKLYVTHYKSVEKDKEDTEQTEGETLLPWEEKLIAISKDNGTTWKFLSFDKKYSGRTLKKEFPDNVIKYLLAGK